MPLYEYRCEACGDTEERLEALSAPLFHDCTECGAPEGMKRQLSTPAFALAGGGWFKEGYSNGAASSETRKPEATPPASGCCTGGACRH